MKLKTLFGRCIYQSPHGLKVYQNYFYRWLTFGSEAVHTLINRKHPEIPSLNYIQQFGISVRKRPSDCCLLGLGGGGIIHALSTCMDQHQFTIVDNHPEMLGIAEQYFMINRYHNVEYLQQDASVFIEEVETQFLNILVDVYTVNSYPEQCNTLSFFQHCKDKLLPSGVLAVNLANRSEQWSVFEKIQAIFNGYTVTLPVKDAVNMIILAYKGVSIVPLLDLIRGHEALKDLSWDPKWGCIAHIN